MGTKVVSTEQARQGSDPSRGSSVGWTISILFLVEQINFKTRASKQLNNEL